MKLQEKLRISWPSDEGMIFECKPKRIEIGRDTATNLPVLAECNTLITSDQNLNRDYLIQLIFGVFLIHYDRFY